MILVTGASGQLGAGVVEHLLTKIPANEIAVLVRDAQKVAALQAKGVSVRTGDYHDVASLQTAFDGIDKVLLISSNDFNNRIGQHKNVVDAAKAAGVKHLLYTGVALKDIQTSPLKPLLEDHFLTEAYIEASGLHYTFLRNSLYFEVVPMFLGAQVLETGVYFAAGEGKVAFASRQELAEATANILVSDGHENKIYPLTGATAYSFAEVAQVLSAIAGKTVGYHSPESSEFEGFLRQIGLPDGIVLMSVLFAAGVKNTDFEETDASLETWLGRKPIDLQTFLQSVFA